MKKPLDSSIEGHVLTTLLRQGGHITSPPDSVEELVKVAGRVLEDARRIGLDEAETASEETPHV